MDGELNGKRLIHIIYIYILILLHPGLIDPVSGLGNPLGRIKFPFPYHKERIDLTMLLASIRWNMWTESVSPMQGCKGPRVGI